MYNQVKSWSKHGRPQQSFEKSLIPLKEETHLYIVKYLEPEEKKMLKETGLVHF